MATAEAHPVPPEIRRTLAALRSRIRAYVWIDGLLRVAIWIVAAFFAALALDYLPVLAGATEMPRIARAALLAILILGALYLFVRYVVRRAFRKLSDVSMAVLLERKYGGFRDSLLTSVELDPERAREVQYREDLLDRTREQAVEALRDAPVGRTLAKKPLVWKGLVAFALVALFVGFAIAYPGAALLGAQRIFLLSSEDWPRSAHIEIVGVEPVRDGNESAAQAASQLVAPIEGVVPFVDDRVKIAKGQSLRLLVRADAHKPVVPDRCAIRYWTEDGSGGRVYMRKVGSPSDGWQSYSYDLEPFKGILSTFSFAVIGFDHRLAERTVEVVEAPAIVEAQFACVFPEYMVDRANSIRLPRTQRYSPGMQLPQGTQIRFLGTANKPLSRVFLRQGAEGETRTLNVEGNSFAVDLGTLETDLDLEIVLEDVDQVTSDAAERFFVGAVVDEAPQILVQRQGIGSAVTPDVNFPVAGTIADDYGVAKAWYEVQVGEADAQTYPLPLKGAEVTDSLDFRDLRGRAQGTLRLAPGERLSLIVKAEDRYDLNGAPSHVGLGDRHELDVVTPEELLRRLEIEEASYRRLLEQTIEELTLTRESLVRVKFDGLGGPSAGAEPGDADQTSAGAEPGDAAAAEAAGDGALEVRADVPGAAGDNETAAAGDNETTAEGENETGAEGDEETGVDGENDVPAAGAMNLGAEPGDAEAELGDTSEERLRTLRHLRVQQAVLQSQKSAGETLGTAYAFRQIREQIVNNRIDSEDRKARLENEIAVPLERVGEELFPTFEQSLAELDQALDGADRGVPQADVAIAELDRTILELDAVLQKLIKFETYNELLDIVRSILDDQKSVLERTQKERENEAFDSLLE
ncbi:MAG TPA: hypothetical protein VGN57_19435 [Pirellulaceae bacterium]|jgi:hypothetical protein|nr:hypothetical protein [Pirellulaceae bacterium]